MVRLGNFFFRYRNGLFPLAYVFLFTKTSSIFPDYIAAAWVGLAVALAGQFLRIATVGLDYIVRGGRNRQVYANDLVTGGLFAHCRNPLYVGNYLILVGLGIASGSAIFLFIVLPFMTLAYAAIIAAEENFLRNKFGEVFDHYCARVSRILFNPSGLGATLQGSTFHWPRVVVKEYGTMFSSSVGYLLILTQNAFIYDGISLTTPYMVTLEIILGALIVLYLVARILKKREIIRG